MLKFIISFAKSLFKHDLMSLSAALAFYTVLSLPPILLLIITAAGYLGFSSELFLINEAKELLGTTASKAIDVLVKYAHKQQNTQSMASLFGISALLFSSSAVFFQLQSSLNIVLENEIAPNTQGWLGYLRNRFFSIGMVILFCFLSLVSFIANALFTFIFSFTKGLWQTLNELITLSIFTIIFACIFKSFSSVKIPWKHLLIGGLFTSILFTIGKYLIRIYIAKTGVGSAYGASVSLIILLVWLYYSSLIVFIGAKFTLSLFRAHKTGLL